MAQGGRCVCLLQDAGGGGNFSSQAGVYLLPHLGISATYNTRLFVCLNPFFRFCVWRKR